MQRSKPLARKTRLRSETPKRRTQRQQYRVLADQYLRDHPICEVWLREKKWDPSPRMPGYFVRMARTTDHFSAETLIAEFDAPRSTEVHHMNKRRGTRLIDTNYFLAVCRLNHDRIENNKAWARHQGFLLNF